MIRGWKKPAAAGTCAATLLAIVLLQNQPIAAGPKPDLKPTAHWGFDTDGVKGNKVADRLGRLPGTLLGSPKVAADGPTPRLELADPADGVMVRDRVTPDADFLPKDA